MNVGLQVHHAACRCRWALGPSIGNEHHTHGGGGGLGRRRRRKENVYPGNSFE